MKTEGTNLLMLTMSAFWRSSRWPLARWPRCVLKGREVSTKVVVIDRFHCTHNGNESLQGMPWNDMGRLGTVSVKRCPIHSTGFPLHYKTTSYYLYNGSPYNRKDTYYINTDIFYNLEMQFVYKFGMVENHICIYVKISIFPGGCLSGICIYTKDIVLLYIIEIFVIVIIVTFIHNTCHYKHHGRRRRHIRYHTPYH